MKLRDLLAGVPLTGEMSNREMEINSISTRLEADLKGALFVELPGGETAAEALASGAAAVLPVGEDPWGTLAKLAGNWFCHPGKRMTLMTVAGSGDSAQVVHLLDRMLRGMPRVRVGVIAPDRVWINGVELPAEGREDGLLWVQRTLRHMADGGCTHVILQVDERGLTVRDCAGLRMSVTALTGPVEKRETLVPLLRSSDTVVLNLDERGWEDYGSIIPESTFTYSENKACADLLAKNLRLFPGHMEFEAVTVGHIQRIHLPVPGGYSLYHSLCVLACGVCLGLKWERMARALRCVAGPGDRLEVLNMPAAYTVVLDGADEPGAVERLLTCAREFTAGQLICVLGCPAYRDPVGYAQLGAVVEQLADRILLSADALNGAERANVLRQVRSGMGGWQRPCRVESCRQQAIAAALEQAEPGDVIVLAGQKGRNTPDERLLVRECMSRRKKQVVTGA